MVKNFRSFLRLFFKTFRPCVVPIRARNPEIFKTEYRPLFDKVRFDIIR